MAVVHSDSAIIIIVYLLMVFHIVLCYRCLAGEKKESRYLKVQ